MLFLFLFCLFLLFLLFLLFFLLLLLLIVHARFEQFIFAMLWICLNNLFLCIVLSFVVYVFYFVLPAGVVLFWFMDLANMFFESTF